MSKSLFLPALPRRQVTKVLGKADTTDLSSTSTMTLSPRKADTTAMSDRRTDSLSGQSIEFTVSSALICPTETHRQMSMSTGTLDDSSKEFNFLPPCKPTRQVTIKSPGCGNVSFTDLSMSNGTLDDNVMMMSDQLNAVLPPHQPCRRSSYQWGHAVSITSCDLLDGVSDDECILDL